MPVHNALPHLDEAVESILGQSFGDFEFVILDDASTDGSTERLRHWAALDPRIRLLEGKKNLGPVGSSNKVAKAAKAPIVARMDGDDISHPDRLAEEFALLRAHPEVGVVGSVSVMIDTRGRKVRDPELWRLSRRSVFVPFAHGVMMYRRDIFDKVGGYRPECEYWEDHDLVVRMAAITKVLVVPWPLYRLRQSRTSTRLNCKHDRLERALDRFYRATDLLRTGKDYEGVLHPKNKSSRIDPRVIVSIGSLNLWVGGKPRLFRRSLSRCELSLNLATIRTLVWTAWASVNPASLRAFLLLLLTVHNRLASVRNTTIRPILWNPMKAPTVVHAIGERRDMRYEPTTEAAYLDGGSRRA